MKSRVLAIGDIHGCAKALAGLIDYINPMPTDVVVTLGDYVDRGFESCGVLNQMIALQSRCQLIHLLGNHDEMMLKALISPAHFKMWLLCGGRDTLASYGKNKDLNSIPEQHWQFLKECQDYWENDTHFFVHANYDPNLKLEKLTTEVLRWQYLDVNKAKPHSSGKTAILGHTIQRNYQILDLGFLKCIDTGCASDGCLTGLDVNTGQIWQVDDTGRRR